MDLKTFLTVFSVVFVAELGDKTQLATFLFATDHQVNRWIVFFGSSAALILTSALGVLAGSLMSDYINTKFLHYVAGAGFVLIGVWTLIKA